MNVVLYLNKNEKKSIQKIVEHFISYGKYSFIIFSEQRLLSSQEEMYYKLNDISVWQLSKKDGEGAIFSLTKIIGTLQNGKFFIVYGDEICNFDLDIILKYHASTQRLATLIELDCEEKKMIGAIYENEVFDYFEGCTSLEREVIKKICWDNDVSVVKCKA